MNQVKDFTARRFPRIAHVSSRQIIRLDDAQTAHKNLVMTKNLSPIGVCFSTPEALTPGSSFLIYLNDLEVEGVRRDANLPIKAGEHYLAQVVWRRQVSDNLFDIGASFFEKERSSVKEVELLTELVNAKALDEMSAYVS